MIENYKEVPIERLGSLVTSFSSENLPPGVSPANRNVRYGMNSVATRYGLQVTMDGKRPASVNGLGMLLRTGVDQIPLVFYSDGKLTKETIVGSGNLDELAFNTQVTIPAGAQMQMASTFQRMYTVSGDLKVGTGTPMVTDGTNCDPMTQRPVGELWAGGEAYAVGHVVTPTAGNGHMYRCTTAGVSGAVEPVWPVTDGGVVNDGTCIWTEYTMAATNILPVPPAPVVARVAALGGFAAGRDVYIKILSKNGIGSTSLSGSASIINTVLNDRVAVTLPAAIASYFGGLAAPYAFTGFEVYEADVVTGNPAPVDTAYKLVAGGPYARGAVVNVDAAAGGAAPPLLNTARIVPVGNVCAGIRYASVMFVNRFDNISGFNDNAVITINVDVAGFRLYFGNIPIGPSNTTQRVLTIGVAKLSNKGPFFVAPINDNANGIVITKFFIPDNVTTSAVLNFTDDYIQTATVATNNLRKVKLKPQADIAYIPSLDRLACVGESGQPSLIRWTEPNDPETVYGDNGYQYIARDNGERLIGVRETRQGQIIAFKERSAYQIRPTNTAPLNWEADLLWTKSGPSGPRALDQGNDFIVYAHKSGAFVYDGSAPVWLNEEIRDLWAAINWDYGHLVSVCIDEEEREIHFAVPFGNATAPNVVFTMSYKRGLEAPIHFSAFTGREVAGPTARKWTISDIKASVIRKAERRLEIGPDVYLSQLLFGSPDLDGVVNRSAPDVYDDNGQGIDSYYETASVGKGTAIYQLGGVTLAVKGIGKLRVEGVPYHGAHKQLKDIDLAVDDDRFYRRQGRGQSRQWGIRVGNGKQPGAWFELYQVNMYLNPIFKSEAASAGKI